MKLLTHKLVISALVIGLTLTLLSTFVATVSVDKWGSPATEYGSTKTVRRGWPFAVHTKETCTGYCIPVPYVAVDVSGLLLNAALYSTLSYLILRTRSKGLNK